MNRAPSVPTAGSLPADLVPPTGVFDADPRFPPSPPLGALAFEIVIDDRVVGYCWVAPELAGDDVRARCWSFLEDNVKPPAVGLRLVR